jgi:hypothetical protein
MPPLWKIKRELMRPMKQLGGVGRVAAGRLTRIRYDAFERQKSQVTPGDIAASQNMVVYLIYQPNGFHASLDLTLEHFNEKGLSTIVVCNHALSDEQRAQLKPKVHLVIERPNIGYDFGGYRDGILTVFKVAPMIENLFVVNDSVWFPLSRNCTLIETALSAPADAYGVFLNTRTHRDAHLHIQSYFYRFNVNVVRTRAFRRMWKKMSLYQNRADVISQLEVKTTGNILEMGFEIDALYKPQDIVAATMKLSDAQFKDLVDYHYMSSLPGRKLFEDMVKLDPGTAGWAEARKSMETDSRYKYYFIHTHPHILFGQLSSPILKKSREYPYYFQRDATVQLGYADAFDPIVRQEVAIRNLHGTPDDPPSEDFAPLTPRASI